MRFVVSLCLTKFRKFDEFCTGFANFSDSTIQISSTNTPRRQHKIHLIKKCLRLVMKDSLTTFLFSLSFFFSLCKFVLKFHLSSRCCGFSSHSAYTILNFSKTFQFQITKHEIYRFAFGFSLEDGRKMKKTKIKLKTHRMCTIGHEQMRVQAYSMLMFMLVWWSLRIPQKWRRRERKIHTHTAQHSREKITIHLYGWGTK